MESLQIPPLVRHRISMVVCGLAGMDCFLEALFLWVIWQGLFYTEVIDYQYFCHHLSRYGTVQPARNGGYLAGFVP
jgi:hypothetical protein